MKIEKSIEFLDFLLKPLEIKVGYGKICTNIMFFRPAREESGKEEIQVSINSHGYQLGHSVDTMFENLFSSVMSFSITSDDKVSRHVESMHVNNPYLGCKSLEEAVIRRDLLAERR